MSVHAVLRVLAAVVVAAAIGACGDEGGAENAVEAREENVVRIDGLAYRAVLFRELNPHIPPDQSLVEGTPSGPDRGLYAAFIRVCNESEEQQTPTGQIVLEDAFGQVFRPLAEGVTKQLAYQPRPLAPGECVPAADTPASRTFDGAPLVYEVPYEAVQRRPMVLEIRPRGDREPVRIVLDL